MADTLDLGSSAPKRAGSSPVIRTNCLLRGKDERFNLKRICDILRKTALFQGLDQKIYRSYCENSKLEVFWKGDLIVQEGDRCEGLIVIVEGQAALLMTSPNGDYSTLNLLGEGDTFGESLFFGTRRFYQSSLEAATNGKYLFISRQKVLEMIAQSPQLLSNILASLSDTIYEQDRRINLLSQRSLRRKISAYLIDLLRDQLEEKGTSLKNELQIVSTPAVELPVSKAMVAKLLAMPRPSLSRELISMEEDGLIKVAGRVIWLLDLKELSAGQELEDF